MEKNSLLITAIVKILMISGVRISLILHRILGVEYSVYFLFQLENFLKNVDPTYIRSSNL
jgi:hypothetical protein